MTSTSELKSTFRKRKIDEITIKVNKEKKLHLVQEDCEYTGFSLYGDSGIIQMLYDLGTLKGHEMSEDFNLFAITTSDDKVSLKPIKVKTDKKFFMHTKEEAYEVLNDEVLAVFEKDRILVKKSFTDELMASFDEFYSAGEYVLLHERRDSADVIEIARELECGDISGVEDIHYYRNADGKLILKVFSLDTES